MSNQPSSHACPSSFQLRDGSTDRLFCHHIDEPLLAIHACAKSCCVRENEIGILSLGELEYS